MVHVELRFGSYLQGDAAAQPSQCHCAVLVLRATLRGEADDGGRPVGKSDGGVGLVPVLAPGPDARKRSSRHWANSWSSESDSQASLLLDDPDLSVLSRDDE